MDPGLIKFALSPPGKSVLNIQFSHPTTAKLNVKNILLSVGDRSNFGHNQIINIQFYMQ